MHATLKRLLRDHEQMRGVLAVIDPVGAEPAEEDRIACILDFLCEYPHWVHHPIEEAMFERLDRSRVSAADRRAVDRVHAQHEALERETNVLFERLEDPHHSRAALNDDLLKYVEAQLTHMAFEERVIFPVLVKALTDQDWAELDAFYAEDRDPLFRAVQRRYKALYPHLVTESGDGTYGSSAVLRFLDATG